MRIVIADDYTLVRSGLRLLLETIPGFTVVGEAADGAVAVELIETLRPDVALMDLAMPGLSGVEATRRATALAPEVPIVVLSMHSDERWVHQAMAAGARGYLVKTSDKQELELALRAAVRGEQYLTPAVQTPMLAGLMTRDASVTPLDLLTSRQREILQLVAEGHTSKAIASRLGLSVKTVETHRGDIMQRLGIRDLTGLVRFAMSHGLVAGSSL